MTYTICPDVLCREIAGETVLFHLDITDGTCPDIKLLNEAGVYYWSMLTQSLTTEQILARAASDTDASVDDLRPGLTAFLRNLANGGFIALTENGQ